MSNSAPALATLSQLTQQHLTNVLSLSKSLALRRAGMKCSTGSPTLTLDDLNAAIRQLGYDQVHGLGPIHQPAHHRSLALAQKNASESTLIVEFTHHNAEPLPTTLPPSKRPKLDNSSAPPSLLDSLTSPCPLKVFHKLCVKNHNTVSLSTVVNMINTRTVYPRYTLTLLNCLLESVSVASLQSTAHVVLPFILKSMFLKEGDFRRGLLCLSVFLERVGLADIKSRVLAKCVQRREKGGGEEDLKVIQAIAGDLVDRYRREGDANGEFWRNRDLELGKGEEELWCGDAGEVFI